MFAPNHFEYQTEIKGDNTTRRVEQELKKSRDQMDKLR